MNDMVIVSREDIIDVANEIRTLSGTSNKMSFNDMKETLKNIDVSSSGTNIGADAISAHNTNATSHADIRNIIT
jgi:hypothetical protein